MTPKHWHNVVLEKKQLLRKRIVKFNLILINSTKLDFLFQSLMIKACLGVKLVKKMRLKASPSHSILPPPVNDWSNCYFILNKAHYFYDNKQKEIVNTAYRTALITLNTFMRPAKIPIWKTGWSIITIEQKFPETTKKLFISVAIY